MGIPSGDMTEIMQLPDHCFGARWPVGVTAAIAAGGAVYDLSDVHLPDNMMIWAVTAYAYGTPNDSVLVNLALGDFLPTTYEQFVELEQLFDGVKDRSGARAGIEVQVGGPALLPPVRIPVVAAGRRLVGRFIRAQGTAIGAQAIITISSVTL